MDKRIVKHGKGLHNCKCGLCEHDVRVSCIEGKCYCCDLEDMFALLTQQEFEPQSKFVTEQRLKDALAC